MFAYILIVKSQGAEDTKEVVAKRVAVPALFACITYSEQELVAVSVVLLHIL